MLRHRTTAVWLGLVLATVLSSQLTATIVILAVAFAKVRFVALDFMELRHAPAPLRACFELWIAGVPTVLAVIYLVG